MVMNSIASRSRVFNVSSSASTWAWTENVERRTPFVGHQHVG